MNGYKGKGVDFGSQKVKKSKWGSEQWIFRVYTPIQYLANTGRLFIPPHSRILASPLSRVSHAGAAAAVTDVSEDWF